MDINPTTTGISVSPEALPSPPSSEANLLSPQRTRSFSIPATPDPFESFMVNHDDVSIEHHGTMRQQVYSSHPILISLAQATQSPRAGHQSVKRVSLVEALDFDKASPNINQLPFATAYGDSQSSPGSRVGRRQRQKQNHPQKSGVSKRDVYNTDEEGIIREM